MNVGEAYREAPRRDDQRGGRRGHCVSRGWRTLVGGLSVLGAGALLVAGGLGWRGTSFHLEQLSYNTLDGA